MDLSFLDKSSGVTPLLVKLYDSQKLYGLAKDKKPQARAELTGAISQLLDMDLSTREIELIADVLIALMRQAETELRQVLAERLSTMDNVPLRVVLQIANDTIDVASPILRNSKVLSDMDLIYIIKSKSASYWQAIAARHALTGDIINILADTHDVGTAITLAENNSITLTEHAVLVLADMAGGEEELAMPLLRRDEIGKDIISKLYQAAGQSVRQHILENFEVDTNILIDTVDEIALDFASEIEGESVLPTENMLEAADRFQAKGLLTMSLILGTLKRGQIQSFVALFSKFINLSPETVSDILLQPSGQGLAIACRAFEISKQDFVSMYLLSNRVRNIGKMVDMKDMGRALQYFERINPEVARDIMKNSMGQPKPLN